MDVSTLQMLGLPFPPSGVPLSYSFSTVVQLHMVEFEMVYQSRAWQETEFN